CRAFHGDAPYMPGVTIGRARLKAAVSSRNFTGEERVSPRVPCYEPANMNRPARISFVSLGCPKALVDSERIITRLRAEGYELARDHAGADLAIVNTCGFLD